MTRFSDSGCGNGGPPIKSRHGRLLIPLTGAGLGILLLWALVSLRPWEDPGTGEQRALELRDADTLGRAKAQLDQGPTDSLRAPEKLPVDLQEEQVGGADSRDASMNIYENLFDPPPPWNEVQHHFEGAFLVPDEDMADFREQIVSVELEADLAGRSAQARLSLEEWDEDELDAFMGGLGIPYLSEPESVSAVRDLRSRTLERLALLADHAEALYQDSLTEYFRSESFMRIPSKEPGMLPPNFHEGRGGIFHQDWAVGGWGWKILVSFDSVDYPVLEDVLLEAERVKSNFRQDLLGILLF